MQKIVRVFLWGLIISFLGSLPMGTLNVTAMQIGIQESITHALMFATGSLLVEMVYVRISLVAINWVRKQERLMKIMEWLTFFIILALAVGSFAAAIKGGADTKNIMLQNNMNRLLLGMFMCAINPVQIPFWFGWSTVLFSKKILQPVKSQYNGYIVGIGLGTLMGNCVFIFGGKWLVERIHNSEAYLNWVIGGIFAISAVIQFYKIVTHKDAVDKIQHIEEKDIPPEPVEELG
ncbi:MAG: LysE family transporter [Ferruginibacter sp.]